MKQKHEKTGLLGLTLRQLNEMEAFAEIEDTEESAWKEINSNMDMLNWRCLRPHVGWQLAIGNRVSSTEGFGLGHGVLDFELVNGS